MALGQRSVFMLLVLTTPAYGWGQSTMPEHVASRFITDSVTALLNDINWHGKALASQESWRFSKQKHKTKLWFDIGFVVYSPYVTSSDGITHVTHILPSQLLTISHLPTTTGIFDLSDLTTKTIKNKGGI